MGRLQVSSSVAGHHPYQQGTLQVWTPDCPGVRGGYGLGDVDVHDGHCPASDLPFMISGLRQSAIWP